MVHRQHGVTPLRFDLSELVQRSVATLYSHLVTRPTGRALRIGIEAQITELGTLCVSVLDFTQVVVLDYSCADETVAKLIQRFQAEDRPADVYFVARGVSERHRDPIEEALKRHGLSLVAEMQDTGFILLGEATSFERDVWDALHQLGRGAAEDVAGAVRAPFPEVCNALGALEKRRVVMNVGDATGYASLPSLLI
jgi:hypothetical protein